MAGVKYKLAHKRVSNDKWNLKEKTQQKHLINIFKELTKKLEKEIDLE